MTLSHYPHLLRSSTQYLRSPTIISYHTLHLNLGVFDRRPNTHHYSFYVNDWNLHCNFPTSGSCEWVASLETYHVLFCILANIDQTIALHNVAEWYVTQTSCENTAPFIKWVVCGWGGGTQTHMAIIKTLQQRRRRQRDWKACTKICPLHITIRRVHFKTIYLWFKPDFFVY